METLGSTFTLFRGTKDVLRGVVVCSAIPSRVVRVYPGVSSQKVLCDRTSGPRLLVRRGAVDGEVGAKGVDTTLPVGAASDTDRRPTRNVLYFLMSLHVGSGGVLGDRCLSG